uniref:Uncharacterized protein n=1 Tax=Picea sitchensis TaxID=3332 RepID=A0A6B9XRE6_PICSI|nr:hypothetical protein Q903MT_gene5756 [Picea sitchensis]
MSPGGTNKKEYWCLTRPDLARYYAIGILLFLNEPSHALSRALEASVVRVRFPTPRSGIE